MTDAQSVQDAVTRARESVEALRSTLESLAAHAPETPYVLRQGHTVRSWGRFTEGILDDTLHGSADARDRAARDAAALHAAASPSRSHA